MKPRILYARDGGHLVDVADNARGAERALGRWRFWFHYHHAASRAQGRNVLTVHWQGKCHPVHHILCAARLETHHKPTQPRCILRGFARSVEVFPGVGKWRGGTVARIT